MLKRTPISLDELGKLIHSKDDVIIYFYHGYGRNNVFHYLKNQKIYPLTSKKGDQISRILFGSSAKPGELDVLESNLSKIEKMG